MKYLPVLLLLFALNAMSQKAVEKTFGGQRFDRSLFINHTSDKGYIICGYSNSFSSSHDIYVVKLDSRGSVQWEKTFGGGRTDVGWAATELKEGGYLLMGGVGIDSTNDDIYLARLDAHGNKLWEKTYGNNLYERATQLLPTSDGYYVLIGQRNIIPGKNIDSYILKIDKEGNVLWEKTFGSAVVERTFYAVETPGGELLVSGLILPYQHAKADIYMLKLSSQGEMIWSKTYGEENVHDIAHSFCMNDDKKTYTLTGYIESSKEGFHDALFMQIDENGNLLIKERHSTGEDLRLMHAEPVPDGFIVTGYARRDIQQNLHDAVLLKYDRTGKVKWLQTFGTPDKDDQGYWIVPNADGSCTLVGYTHSKGTNGDVWLITYYQ
ncbi:MAG TPA: hypothetical protein VD993_11580 [Chitinophagaceae bacterium]|nr:hypothetical protein [Chitinophagaceae bacterium]